jgi:hypothetical protein
MLDLPLACANKNNGLFCGAKQVRFSNHRRRAPRIRYAHYQGRCPWLLSFNPVGVLSLQFA